MKNFGLLQYASTVMIGLQIGTVAFAAPILTPAQNDSQERGLLISLETLEGAKFSPQQYKAQALALINNYDQSTPVANRTDRLENAIQELGLMTPAEAEGLKQDVQNQIGQAMAAHPNATQAELGQVSTQAVARALSVPMEGAQFSACQGYFISGSLVLIGAIFGSVYASTIVTKTVNTQYANGSTNGSSTTTSNQGDDTTTVTVHSGSITTTTVNHAAEAQQAMIYAASGIAYGVSAVLAILSMESC